MTFDEILMRVREIINEETDTRYTDVELKAYIELAQYMLMCLLPSEEILRQFSNVTVFSDDNIYPFDFFAPLGASQAGGLIERKMPAELSYHEVWNKEPFWAMLNKLKLYNADNAYLWYLFEPSDYNGTSEPDYPECYHEYIVRLAAALALIRDTSIASELGVRLLEGILQDLGAIKNENSR